MPMPKRALVALAVVAVVGACAAGVATGRVNLGGDGPGDNGATGASGCRITVVQSTSTFGVADDTGAELAFEQYRARRPDCPAELVKATYVFDSDRNRIEAPEPILDAVLAKHPAAAAGYLTGALNAARVLLLMEQAKDEQGALVTELKARLGARITGTELLSGNVADVAGRITRAAPTAVYYTGTGGAGMAALLAALRRAGNTVPFVGGARLAEFPFSADERQHTAGAVSITPYPADTVPTVQFREQYRAQYGEAPSVDSATAYDAAVMLLAGIEAGHRTPEKLAAFVAAYDADGAAGHYRFDDRGLPVTAGTRMYALTASATGWARSGPPVPVG